jgi:2,2-dialkylglycine decarboxylase (pyruvate)
MDSTLRTRDFLAPVVQRTLAVMSRGRGSFVWDTAGRRYLDLNAGQFCSIFGHSHPEVAEFVHRQALKLQNTSTTTIGEEALAAAERLHHITQDMDGRSVFLSTGAEANECCLRYAKHLTGRPGVISFEPAWHGLTLGTECLSVSRRHVKPPVAHTYPVPVPPVRGGDELSAADLDRYVEAFVDVVRRHGDHLAAAIFEPIVSSGGMLFPPKEYFDRVLKICREHGILLVFDECQTGFGRTGSWFYYQQLDCVPDFVVCAKGLGLGYPVSAVVFRGGLVPPDGFKMQLFSSHQNDPFGCAIVSFAVDWIVRHNLLARIAERGRYFLERLKALSHECPLVHKPRGRGLMLSFDLMPDGRDDYADLSKRFLAALLDRGCLLQAANAGRTMRLLPNYLVENEEIDLFVDTVRDVVRREDFGIRSRVPAMMSRTTSPCSMTTTC